MGCAAVWWVPRVRLVVVVVVVAGRGRVSRDRREGFLVRVVVVTGVVRAVRR
jgi:hypothetical protein